MYIRDRAHCHTDCVPTVRLPPLTSSVLSRTLKQVFCGPPLTRQDHATLQKANEFETLMVNQNRVAAGLFLAAIMLSAYLHVPASSHAHVHAYTAICPHVSFKLGTF
jgi:hypothetical protein